MRAKQVSGFLALAALLLAGIAEYRKTDDTPAPAPSPAREESRITAPKASPKAAQGSGFDFYVLSLSWSPTFCQSGEARDGDPQCATDKPRGFVVHGLWPQNEKGYPQFCESREPERVPSSIGRDLSAFMPSMGLIGHQWRKHGTCSGLSQQDYFATLASAWKRLKMPERYADGRQALNDAPQEIEKAFIAANPGLSPAGIAVTCDGRKLDEVRICFTKDLDFRACGEVDRQACRADTITLPAAR